MSKQTAIVIPEKVKAAQDAWLAGLEARAPKGKSPSGLLSEKSSKLSAAIQTRELAKQHTRETLLWDRPKDSFTVREFAAEQGITIDAADKRIKRLFEAGRLDRGLFQLYDETGRTYRTYVYVESRAGRNGLRRHKAEVIANTSKEPE